MNKTWNFLGRLAYRLSLPAIRLVMGRTDRAYLVLVAEDRLLMVKGWLGRQHWQLPGGGIKTGEQPEATLLRELKEEAGIDLTGAKLTLIDSGKWRTDRLKHGYQIYMTSLSAQPRVQKHGLELVELRWLKPMELKPANTPNEILAALKSARLI